MKFHKIFILLLCMLAFNSHARSESYTLDQNYDKGKYYSLKYKYELAKPYLKKSADAGNADAMLRYAFLVNVQHGLFLNPEAFEYVVKSADKGNEWAMSLLADYKYSGTSEAEAAKWQEKLDARLEPYLDEKDKDALLFMSHVEFYDNEEKWLVKAAEAGSDEAMIRLAAYYENGNGWFIIPGAREDRINELSEEANKLGNRQAILSDGARYVQSGDIKKGENEWQKLIDKGDADAIQSIATFYHNEDQLKSIYNLEKSARLMKVYLDSMGSDGKYSLYNYFEREYPKIYSSLTAEEQQRVDQWVTDYLATHDVLAPDTVWETKFK